MELIFANNVNIKLFYDSYLPQLLKYAYKSEENNLILDLQGVTFISPSVICDLLSCLNFIKKKKNDPATLLFGWNTPLVAFLENTDFFLMADVGRVVLTDVVFSSTDNVYSTHSRFKKIKDNTDKIRRLNLPTDRDFYGDEIIYHKKGGNVEMERDKVNQMVQKDFYSLVSRKGRAIQELGIPQYHFYSLANAYAEIMINSYFHGGSNYGFYTFQNYNKSGLSFVSSDTAMGYYNSIKEKIEERKRSKGLFSDTEFLKEESNQIRSLMGIIEGILYRHYNPKLYFDHGIMDIIKIILGVARKNNAILRIQSDYAMLQLDAVSLRKLFDGMKSDDKDCGSYTDIVPNELTFKDIVFNSIVQKEWIKSKHIVFFDYCFPGVHISATIDPPKPQ